jgi:CPA2 family monovalent cation:H+ antiporter-2
VIGDFLYPVVVAVSVITTFLTPYMIRLATPAYQVLEKRLPKKWVRSLNHLTMSHPNTKEQSLWKKLLLQMGRNTLIYGILSAATITLMFTFVLPVTRQMLPGWDLHWYANAITGLLTVVFISPFLRAMVMKKNHSEEFMTLWKESNINRIPLLFTILVRIIIAVAFIFYICNYLTRFSNALMITIGVVAVLLIILSRWIKKRSIHLERLFILNLRSRDIEAQVHGHKRPLYEGKLLDRNIHITDFEIPADSLWTGKSLKELNLGKKYGIHVSSILRANRRLNIPDGDSILFPGDKLQVIGSDDQLIIFQQALEREVMDDDYELEKREMKLRSIIINGSSPFIGKTLQESGIRDHYNCMVVGLEEGKENLSQVKPSYRFQKGDIIWIVGEEQNIKQITAAS